MPDELAMVILQNCSLAVMVADAERRVIWTNALFNDLVEDRLLGEHLDSLQSKGYQWLLDHGGQMELDGKGWARWIRISRKEIAAHTVWFYEDISEVQQLRREIEQEQYGTDPLTGLLNNRALMQILEPQVSRSRRYHNPLSIVFLQVKPFLCEAGSQTRVKEQTLLDLSRMLKEQIRWADQIGRFREEAFLLILPETLYEDARKLASKLSKSISRLNQSLQKGQEKIVAAFGVSQWQKGDDTFKFLRRAECSLEAFQI